MACRGDTVVQLDSLNLCNICLEADSRRFYKLAKSDLLNVFAYFGGLLDSQTIVVFFFTFKYLSYSLNGQLLLFFHKQTFHPDPLQRRKVSLSNAFEQQGKRTKL